MFYSVERYEYFIAISDSQKKTGENHNLNIICIFEFLCVNI